MRKWLLRLRTLLAILAALYLLYQFPALSRWFTKPSAPEPPSSSIEMVRVWLLEDWSGSAMQWVSRQATAFEKAHRGVRIILKRAQPGDWALEGAVLPDVLLFSGGVLTDPEGLLAPLSPTAPVRDFLQGVGDRGGIPYAVPLAYGGRARLVNEQKPDAPALTMRSAADYQAFVAGEAGSLVATVREVRRFAALVAAGKGFPFHADAYGESTDLLLMAGMITGAESGAEYAREWIDFLLSDAAQGALAELGMLPASAAIPAPDIGQQPLLHALFFQIQSATNAFDEPVPNEVQ
ncbi:MAG: hypothetical protein LBM74_06950 [Oscillospiraceae bacterium]|jgi:hypothetical protein|nr:hypothetical protein [Oscillospiraceae bacterium]